MFIKIWLCAFVLPFVSTMVNADEIKKGTWYLGAGLGITELDPDVGSTGYSLTNERDSGFKLFAGFDYSERLTVEGFYADLGTAKLGNHVIKPDGAIDYSTMGASALWYFWRDGNSEGSALRKGLQMYVHGGLSFLDNSSSVSYAQDNNVQVQYGAGLEYGLKNGLAVRAGLDLYDKDAGMAFVGIIKRFGTKPKPKVIKQSVVEPVVEVVPEPVIIVDVDTDKDGIIDRLDVCANSPSGISVDEKGCSIIAIEMEGVNFEPQSFELTKDSKRILDEAVLVINANPALKIEVQAYTDSKGSEKYNLKLSEKRAASVKKYLVIQGANEDQLEAKGYGESEPIADNNTEAGRAKNRRVALSVIKDEVKVLEVEQQEIIDVTLPEDSSSQVTDESATDAEQAKVDADKQPAETENTVKVEEKKSELEDVVEVEDTSSESVDEQ